MASLRFSFGTMGSGKSTVALQIHHNLSSRELYGLLLTTLDREGRQVTSRLGVGLTLFDAVIGRLQGNTVQRLQRPHGRAIKTRAVFNQSGVHSLR